MTAAGSEAATTAGTGTSTCARTPPAPKWANARPDIGGRDE